MASIRSNNYRRRYRSASITSPVARRSPDTSLRIAAKRAYPMYTFSPINHNGAPHKWDVECRRGKRKRRGLPSQDITIGFIPDQEQHNISPAAPVQFTFPASSADFNLFPKSDCSSRCRASYSPSSPDTGLPDALNHSELTRLRSNAFWDLHRSVAENGEGFVQRMRDYERTRSRQVSDPARRGWKRPFNPQTSWTAPYRHDSDVSDDDSDVQIFAGEGAGSPSSSRHTKRGVPLDAPCPNLRQGEVLCSDASRCTPSTQPHSSPSLTYLDDMGFPIPVHIGSPVSVSTFSSASTSPSSLSSVQSLPLDVENCSILSLPSAPSSSFIRQTPSASSEKAVSDLSLAFANGAGSIHDYDCLQNLAGLQHIDGGDPGELWH